MVLIKLLLHKLGETMFILFDLARIKQLFVINVLILMLLLRSASFCAIYYDISFALKELLQ